MTDKYICQHFSIAELVPENLYNTLHEDVLWDMFDPDLLRFADWLKGFCKGASITVNDWEWSGRFYQSGLRTKDSEWYSEGSQHSIGCALDFKVRGYTSHGLRAALRKYEESVAPIPYITRIEDDTQGWLHCDTKPTGMDKIHYFKP